jgi:hypothetical protein
VNVFEHSLSFYQFLSVSLHLNRFPFPDATISLYHIPADLSSELFMNPFARQSVPVHFRPLVLIFFADLV